MLKDSWVLVLQQWGQAKFIISNSHPYNQIKHKGSNSIFPDPPPSPSRAEGSRAAHTNPTAARSADVYACGHLHPSYPEKTIHPGSSHPEGCDTQLGSHLSWCSSRQLQGDAQLPCERSGGTRGKLPATPGMLCWRCLLTGCKQKALGFQSTTKQSPTLQKSPLSSPPCSDIPSTRSFVLKRQPRLSPLAVRSSWCQPPAREPEPVIFIRGCSLWGPSAASQEKQATGENLSLLMAFPPAAAV